MGEKRFDFDEELANLSLSFANTKDWHASDHPVENLNTYDDVIAWGIEAGLLSHDDVDQLNQYAKQNPSQANADYEKAIHLREAIYRIFSNFYAGRRVSPDDLAILSATAQEAMAHQRLTPASGSFRWDWVKGSANTGWILWPVARAAVELLTSEHVGRVRECEDDRGCGYLFIDQTKNRSRRWCSMNSCGNRAKARRHYAKVKRVESGEE
jgi:predicted RNA-binding Zn ribbon-like protein